jgi:hypothetical protein
MGPGDSGEDGRLLTGVSGGTTTWRVFPQRWLTGKSVTMAGNGRAGRELASDPYPHFGRFWIQGQVLRAFALIIRAGLRRAEQKRFLEVRIKPKAVAVAP